MVRNTTMTGQLSSRSSISSPETQLRLLLDVGDAPQVGTRTEDDVCRCFGLEITYAELRTTTFENKDGGMRQRDCAFWGYKTHVCLISQGKEDCVVSQVNVPLGSL